MSGADEPVGLEPYLRARRTGIELVYDQFDQEIIAAQTVQELPEFRSLIGFKNELFDYGGGGNVTKRHVGSSF